MNKQLLNDIYDAQTITVFDYAKNGYSHAAQYAHDLARLALMEGWLESSSDMHDAQEYFFDRAKADWAAR